MGIGVHVRTIKVWTGEMKSTFLADFTFHLFLIQCRGENNIVGNVKFAHIVYITISWHALIFQNLHKAMLGHFRSI